MKSGKILIAMCVVAAVVSTVYRPCLSARALMFDDDQYLVENRLVQNPGWNSTRRFFSEVLRPSSVAGYYQPIAMTSLMLDVAMGAGVDNLRQFHRTSLFLHVANSVLVVLLLYLLFDKAWPAAMMGLLYGLHPVTVESVVWVAERKTVLAAFFALLCLVGYILYVRKKKWWLYGVSVVACVLSLLSKPGVVAMPVLLLLFDWWPLGRFGRGAVLEKLPFFIIAAVVCAVTFISQSSTAWVHLPGESGAFHSLFVFCHNVVFYFYNFFWPARLSWYYPFPQPFELSHPLVLSGVIGTCVLLVVLPISFRFCRSLFVGILFYFAAILPVIGIVGIHPMIAADRHLYFPMIGLFLPAAYLAGRFQDVRSRLFKLGQPVRRVVLVSAVVILAWSQSVLTRSYLVYWKDSETVYKYMLGHSPDVVLLHNNLGNVLKEAGRTGEAMEHFARSLELAPDSAQVHTNLGNTLRKLGRPEQALKHLRTAVRLQPNLAAAHYNLAAALAEQGKNEQAIIEYQKVLELAPEDVDALRNSGSVSAKAGRFEEAVRYLKKAIELEPDSILAHGRLGLVLGQMGKTEQAIKECRFVLGRRPGDVDMRCNLGILLQRQGNISEAIAEYRKVLEINPNFRRAQNLLKAAQKKQKSR